MEAGTASDWLEAERERIERALERAVPPEDEPPAGLHRAMRYGLLGGGKRLRPLLCRAAAWAVADGECEAAWAPACAIECVHAYSLIHDDLPALDNDDLRRGRPTCHVVFGEAMAILAGDALLTRAFALLAAAPAAAAMVAQLAEAAGTPAGMVAGQVADLEAERTQASLAAVRFIHQRKTAALIRASVLLGGLAAGATSEQQRQLAAFGEAIGLAFQITDDLLDRTASRRQLGKTPGKDAAQAKATYPAAVGAAAAAETAQELIRQAQAELAAWGASADRLRHLAHRMVERNR